MTDTVAAAAALAGLLLGVPIGAWLSRSHRRWRRRHRYRGEKIFVQTVPS